jgi:ElaB/YqjD/DUF883 family membrane-anchored ribosome-binding protein
MRINYFPVSKLLNDTHFQYHCDFNTLVKRYGAEQLKIAILYVAYVKLLNDEDISLKKILKSILTAEVQEADKYRDQIWRGMADANKSAMNHYDGEVRAAAGRNKIVFDTYGNVAQKPYNDETSAIYNFIQDMRGKFAKDVATAGLTGWIDELEKANNAFSQLSMDRYDESAAKTALVMKETRVKVDEAYRKIIERINAAIIMDGEEDYREFVNTLNAIIKKYSDTLAQRQGKAAAKKEPKEPKSE